MDPALSTAFVYDANVQLARYANYVAVPDIVEYFGLQRTEERKAKVGVEDLGSWIYKRDTLGAQELVAVSEHPDAHPLTAPYWETVRAIVDADRLLTASELSAQAAAVAEAAD